MNSKYLLCTLLLIFAFGKAFPQKWNWPEDRATAEEKVAFYTDALKLDHWRTAASGLSWLLANAPDLNVSIYQNGAKIFENLAVDEVDLVKKQVLLDSLMWMYDARMQYFDDSLNVMNRKAYKAYRFYIKSKDKYPYLLDLYDDTFRVSGNNVMDNNIPAYMNVVKVNRLVIKNLSLEDVFYRYDIITEIIDHKIRDGKDLEKQKDLIDKMLTETIPEGIDCDFVINTMEPNYKENPTDLAMAKRIFSFMLNGKCTDKPLFMQVAKEIQRQEPTYGLGYKVIGRKCLAQKDYSCAEKYLIESLDLTEVKEEKASIYIDLGKMKTFQKDKPKAREYYRMALQEVPTNRSAYDGIGNLYYYSVEDCKTFQNQVSDRLPYIAAFEMYKKAGNSNMMQAAKAQFPSKEDIFSNNFTSGQKMDIGCWISTSVILQTRD